MTQDATVDIEPTAATAGDIAAINLESARQRAWSRFWRAPEQPGVAEQIVELEQLTAQFVGDLDAFDRLDLLANELDCADPHSWRNALIAAQVACSMHRFAEARNNLESAATRGAPAEATTRLSLTIDQATGTNLSALLAARRQRFAQSGRWDELIPLGSLLADLGEFDEADRIYMEALREYPDVSPFAPAWVCFQLGVLWGETVPAPQATRAANWYRAAIDYLPCYVKARVHLAEIELDGGSAEGAALLLAPIAESGDPEVRWRLADVTQALGDFSAAKQHLDAARSGFEALLAKHPLAFADHGAEFYLGSGGDPGRASALARMNVDNRPTSRAYDQAHEAALAAGEVDSTAILLARRAYTTVTRDSAL